MQAVALHHALKRVMRARGRTYAQAARVLRLSEAGIQRLFSRADLSLKRLERLCDWVGVDIADLAVLAQEATPLVTELKPEQERELLRDPGLLLVTFLVLNRWSE